MSLKKELLRLLEEDEEFRFAVAGLLGLRELMEELRRLWMEVKALREDYNKRFEEHREELKSLRAEQEKLWMEVKALREGQEKLWENVTKLWEEVRELRRDFREMREEQRRLRASFETFGKALNVTFEHYTCSFVKLMLENMGYFDVEIDRKVLLHDGRIYEVNVFSEDPLVVGEVTLYLENLDVARNELNKLSERIEIAEKLAGKKAMLKLLAVGNASKDVLEYLKEECRRMNIKLIFGREFEVLT
ncbi:MAG: hypothetical protein QXH47_03020 [Candidatus Bathyarchaeia archaeon]